MQDQDQDLSLLLYHPDVPVATIAEQEGIALGTAKREIGKLITRYQATSRPGALFNALRRGHLRIEQVIGPV